MPTGPTMGLGWSRQGQDWAATGRPVAPQSCCFYPRPRPPDQLSVSSPKVAKSSGADEAWTFGLASTGQSLWHAYEWGCACRPTMPAGTLPSWPPEAGRSRDDCHAGQFGREFKRRQHFGYFMW